MILQTVDRTPWTGDQPVARTLLTEDNTNREKRTHPYLEWDSNPPIAVPARAEAFRPHDHYKCTNMKATGNLQLNNEEN
jgi:hypothetical protein